MYKNTAMNEKYAPKHKSRKEHIRQSCVVGIRVDVLWIKNE